MPESPSYRLLDCGHGEKLEEIGGQRVRRPAPQALWAPRRDDWPSGIPHYRRSSSGGGAWENDGAWPDPWEMSFEDTTLLLKATGFGHVGVFAEQRPFWRFLREQCRQQPGLRALNLFAYTGGSTLACARGGADTTHCDASRGVVQWASDNARRNGLADHPIRWIVDDALKFLRREVRREKTYEVIVLDPPSFGRGPKGEVWKLEEGLGEMLALCAALLSPQAQCLLLSAHTPGLGPIGLHGMLQEALRATGRTEGRRACGEMTIPAESGVLLPSGAWATWIRDGELPRPDVPPA